MNDATDKQKRTVARLIAKIAEPITGEEASRVIRDLRREKATFPHLIEKIVEADRADDHDRLGRLLAEAKRRVKHGDWLPLLRRLGMNARRAQRLIRKLGRGETAE